ncbi:PPOX class F420-dependent oxidoreductase [Actinopolymorpha sp. B9G3]|uniref:PPOX class F420-dependent oxidoreductase n=1 Tax=Actinopolymorpha sp. B9G3 TaxID=3158970 RepID=UPI0032D94F59
MTTFISPEIRALLTEDTRTGKVGYVAADGRPLVAPVWFVLEGTDEAPELVFTTNQNTSKGRAIARDPRLVLCVDLEEPPYAFVQVQGVAAVSDDSAELLRTATAVGGRYMGADRAEEFGRRNAVPGELVVRLRATKIVAELDVTA